MIIPLANCGTDLRKADERFDASILLFAVIPGLHCQFQMPLEFVLQKPPYLPLYSFHFRHLHRRHTFKHLLLSDIWTNGKAPVDLLGTAACLVGPSGFLGSYIELMRRVFLNISRSK
jgi:hypothetical protein